MYWLVAAGYGAGGGCVVSAVAFCNDVRAWKAERLWRRQSGKFPLPELGAFMDMKADALVLLTRLFLGATGGVVFHSQIVGTTAAIAIGASAPALLAQFGKTSVREAEPEPETHGQAVGARLPEQRVRPDVLPALGEGQQ